MRPFFLSHTLKQDILIAMKRGFIAGFFILVLLATVATRLVWHPGFVSAQAGEGFSLQVTPSPLVSTITPGESTQLELKIRNTNTIAEQLKMELRTFSVDKATGQVTIDKTVPKDVESFVSFGQDVFTVDAGEWYNQLITVDTPQDAGFSYSFVILISRAEQLPKTEGVSSIEGSVAVFTLLNVNRADATKQLSLASFKSMKRVYEYLPAEFEMVVDNTGNTIVMPKGNVFIGRSGTEKEPLAAPEINPNGGYIVPGTTRYLNIQWNDGFPYRNSDKQLVWDWSRIKQLRIGRYTARAVLIYDDGQRDVPIESEVTFWLFPWKIILGIVAILTVLIVGLYTLIKRVYVLLKPTKKTEKNHQETNKDL